MIPAEKVEELISSLGVSLSDQLLEHILDCTEGYTAKDKREDKGERGHQSDVRVNSKTYTQNKKGS